MTSSSTFDIFCTFFCETTKKTKSTVYKFLSSRFKAYRGINCGLVVIERLFVEALSIASPIAEIKLYFNNFEKYSLKLN